MPSAWQTFFLIDVLLRASGGVIRIRSQRLIFLSLVDEHDGNVVFDAVLQAARPARQLGVLFVVVQIALAFRAHENVEQVLAEHLFLLSGICSRINIIQKFMINSNQWSRMS